MKDIVTKENFAEAYPELCASIEKETFEKGFSEGVEKGKLSGAESERERIKGVEDQLIPGHEDLIASLKYDGKTTGPEAAIMVLKKEKELMASRHEGLIEDGKKAVVKDATPPAIEKAKEVDAATELEKIVKEKMKADKTLSYEKALLETQKENLGLTQQILDQMKVFREKK